MTWTGTDITHFGRLAAGLGLQSGVDFEVGQTTLATLTIRLSDVYNEPVNQVCEDMNTNERIFGKPICLLSRYY